MARKFLLTMLIITLTLGATVVGANPVFNGTWVDEFGTEYRFNNGNWETWFRGEPEEKGTFTADGGVITMRADYVHGSMIDLSFVSDTGWYSIDEVITLAVKEFEEAFDEYFEEVFEYLLMALLELEYTPEQLIAEMDEMIAAVDELFADWNEVFYSEIAEVAEMFAGAMFAGLDADTSAEFAVIIVRMAESFATAVFWGLYEMLEDEFWAVTGTYSVSGNTLALVFDGEVITLTRIR